MTKSSFGDLVGQAAHRRSRDVTIEREGEQQTYEVTEIRSDVYMRLITMGSSLDPKGEEVFDNHRLQSLRIVMALSGDSAIPGDTIDEKMAFMVETPDGKKPAVDFVAGMPRHIFTELNDAVERVCAVSGHANILDLKFESVGDAWMVIAYCAKNKVCLAELAERDIYMSEISAWFTFWKAEKEMEQKQIEAIIEGTGASTADR